MKIWNFVPDIKSPLRWNDTRTVASLTAPSNGSIGIRLVSKNIVSLSAQKSESADWWGKSGSS
jgi:hypothetical protein